MRYCVAILVAALFLSEASFGQCMTVTARRPRIFLNNSGYQSYATVLARLQAAKGTNNLEWKNIYQAATAFLKTSPGAEYYDAVAMEEALVYNLNKVTYAAYGARSPYFLYKALQYLAPTVDITAATNANPTVFTTASAHGLTSGTAIAVVWGGTGNWAAFNLTTTYTITVIDSTHFAIPIDSTSFGPLTGNMTASRNQLVGLNEMRTDGPYMAEAYDWAHDQLGGNLTSDQINQIQNVMAASVGYDSAHPYGWSGTTPSPVEGIGNLFIGPLEGQMEIISALSGDVAGMSSQCSTLRKNFLEIAPIYTTGGTGSGYKIFPLGVGGAYVESTEYSGGVGYWLMNYLEALLGATGENLYSTIGTFPASSVQFLFNDVSPGTASSGGSTGELMPWGDILFVNQHSPRQFGPAGSRQFMEELTYYLCWSGDTVDCAYSEWWLKNVFTEADLARGGGDSTLDPITEFLWYDPTLPAMKPNYPLDYLASGDGELLSRSMSSPSATWLGFKGGGLRGGDEDHFHSDILSFQLYSNGDWLTNNLMNWGGAKLTRFNNVPLPETNQFGTYNEGSNAPSGINDNFAWGTTGMTVDGAIIKHDFNTTLNYAYAEADATSPYNGSANPYTVPAWTAPITAVIRDFLYLKPTIFVVEDRLAYSTALKAEWNIQALTNPGTPTGHSFTLRSLRGSNALNVAIVSPASPTITIATPATQATELTASGCPGGAGVGCASQWRVQVTSGNAVMSEQYFVVMQSGATGFTPLTVTTLTGSNAIAAQFTRYVVGGMTDTSQIGLTRSYKFNNSGPVQHIFMGLKPSRAYKVDTTTVPGTVTISDSGTGSSTTTTMGGVLLFVTSGNSSP
jgi:hypothetical protein